jgi:hypothetical protein
LGEVAAGRLIVVAVTRAMHTVDSFCAPAFRHAELGAQPPKGAPKPWRYVAYRGHSGTSTGSCDES